MMLLRSFRKAVLIIHGFAGGTYDQERLANFLETSLKLDVYSFTLPGHEKRTFKTAKYQEWIKASEDMVEMLIGQGYKSIYLVGHSMGGVIATYLAGKYKEVKKLVLAAPVFNYLVAEDQASVVDKFKSGINMVINNDRDEVFTRFLKLPISSFNEFAKLVEKYKYAYKNIYIPTLVLQGDKDTLVPLKSSEEVFLNIPSKNKKFVILDNYTHDIFREKDDKALLDVYKFLL